MDRTIDEENKTMNMTRLVCIDYALPGWIERIINFRLKGHAMETVNVDLDKKRLSVSGRNISFWNRFRVEEDVIYEVHPENPNHTLFTQVQRYSVLGFPSVSDHLESYCINKGKDAGMKGVKVMAGHLEKIEEKWENRFDHWRQELRDIKIVYREKLKSEILELEEKYHLDQKVMKWKERFNYQTQLQAMKVNLHKLEEKIEELAHEVKDSKPVERVCEFERRVEEGIKRKVERIKEPFEGYKWWRRLGLFEGN